MMSFRSFTAWLALVLVLACGENATLDDGPAGKSSSSMSSSGMGGSGGTGGGVGGMAGASAQGGNGGMTAGTGGAPIFQYRCGNTGLSLDPDDGPLQTIDHGCSMSHGIQFYDGTVAYLFHKGVVGKLTIKSCGIKDNPEVTLAATVDGTGKFAISYATIVHDGMSYGNATGTLTITKDAQEGDVLEGSYEVTFNSGNTPAKFVGSFSACHVPPILGL